MAKVDNVAKYIIGILDVDNLKLQKLLYYCQGVHLVANQEPLFKEDIEARRYGPVVPKVYQTYKSFGFDTITIAHKPKNLSFKKEERLSIDMVLEYFGNMSSL